MKKALTLTVTIFAAQIAAFCQQKQDILDYIAKYKDIAIEEMVRCKIPASVTLAQGIHESSWGKSDLSQQANNHFGIKCKSDWDGKKFFKNDDAPNECFRVYEHAGDSYVDHSDFLVTRSRYAPLFQLPITDYKGWANGLKAYGYATNPKYPQIIISTIEAYNLSQYDELGLAMLQQNKNLLNPVESTNDNSILAAADIAPAKAAPAVAIAAPPVAPPPAPKAQAAAVIPATPSTYTAHTSPVVVYKPAVAKSNNPSTTTINSVAVNPSNSSRKEYVVNGIRALKALGNENPLTIAIDYDLDFARVLSFNDLNQSDLFKDGEYIFLQPKKARAAEVTYTVQPGESMHDISQKFGVRLKDLYLKNEMKFTENEQVLAGEVISLQEKRPASPRTITYSAFLKTQSKNTTAELIKKDTHETPSIATAAIPPPNSQYRVQQSDTLYSIARKFNLSIEQLKAINNLENNPIHPGQTLLVSK